MHFTICSEVYAISRHLRALVFVARDSLTHTTAPKVVRIFFVPTGLPFAALAVGGGPCGGT